MRSQPLGRAVENDIQTFPLRTSGMTPFLRKLRAKGADAIDCHISNNGDITQFPVGLSRLRWQPMRRPADAGGTTSPKNRSRQRASTIVTLAVPPPSHIV